MAKLFCLIAAPVVNLFYKGLDLISTYPDGTVVDDYVTVVGYETARLSGDLVLIAEDNQ